MSTRHLILRSVPATPQVVAGFEVQRFSLKTTLGQQLLVFTFTGPDITWKDIAQIKGRLRCFETEATKILVIGLDLTTKFEILHAQEKPPQTQDERRRLLAYAVAFRTFVDDRSSSHEQLLELASSIEHLLPVEVEVGEYIDYWDRIAESLSYDGTDGP
jgi:hypothetical protein